MRKGQEKDCCATNKVAEREKAFGRKMTVRVLVAEKHAYDCRDRESIENPGLFAGREFQAGKVTIDQRQPAAPDEELQYHHDEEPEADRAVHSGCGEPKSMSAREASTDGQIGIS